MMKRKQFVWLLVSALVIAATVLTSCGATATTTAPATSAPTTTTPTAKANWWDALGTPEYGGEMNVRATSDGGSFDAIGGLPWIAVSYGWYEMCLQYNWATPMDTWSFKVSWAPPDYYSAGLLKSWEWKDPKTLTGHVREGVKWQNKAPSNGRAFTAYDIEDHYNRVEGIGKYTKKAMCANWGPAIQSVTAVDASTIEVHFNTTSPLVNMWSFTDQGPENSIYNPDTVAAGIDDWHNVCGTGPYMLTDYIRNASATLTRNTDYWEKDPRFPNNKLPYVDKISVLVIPDISTALSALRTGKLDYIAQLPWQQAQSLAKTNAELKSATIPSNGFTIEMRVDQKPFTDINVRKAMQMAIDYESIANGFYGGLVPKVPNGLISREYSGFSTPYAQWSADLKAEYTYNVAGAKKLLADAGYPNGFTTSCVASTSGMDSDTTLLQVVQSNFKDIGVTMDINAMDPTTYMQYTVAGKQLGMAMTGMGEETQPPNISIFQYVSGQNSTNLTWSWTTPEYAAYKAMYDKYMVSMTTAEAQATYKADNEYLLKQHWVVFLPANVTYTMYQPYLKGYSGQNMGGMGSGWWWKHLWVDSKAKAAAGR